MDQDDEPSSSAVALGLTVVGDRWTLLIVSDLFLWGPRRRDELRTAADVAIPEDVLTERLHALERSGLLASEGDIFALTPRGRALKPVLRGLIRWSVDHLGAQLPPGYDQAFSDP